MIRHPKFLCHCQKNYLFPILMIMLSIPTIILCIICPTSYVYNCLLIIANILLTKWVDMNMKMDNTKAKVNNSIKVVRTPGIFACEHPKHSKNSTKQVFHSDSIRRDFCILVTIFYRQLFSPGFFLWNNVSTKKY